MRLAEATYTLVVNYAGVILSKEIISPSLGRSVLQCRLLKSCLRRCTQEIHQIFRDLQELSACSNVSKQVQ